MVMKSVRQSYFRILSRLYDLASEFSVDELREVQAAFLQRGNESHATVVGALIEIHNNASVGGSGREAKRSELVSQSIENHSVGNERTRSSQRQIAALSDLLMLHGVFESLEEMDHVLNINVHPRPKESRRRYVGRVMSVYKGLSENEKVDIKSKVMSHTESRVPRSFVSRWSNLIKDL